MHNIILFICMFFGAALQAGDVLDAYVQHALRSNLALSQTVFSYQKSSAALREARGMFLPSASIEVRYTRAKGGRIIEFPVGDLMNPVYATLNLLTGIPAFPTNLQNEHINFFREKEHDTKVRIVQPLFQPNIFFNYKIQKYASLIKNNAPDAYARELIAEVKTA